MILKKNYKKLFLLPFLTTFAFAKPIFADINHQTFEGDIEIADSRLSESQIIKRLNALESEVKDLKRQLKQKSYAKKSINNSKNNFYISGALGTINFDHVTCRDCDESGFITTPIHGDWTGELGIGYRFTDNFRGEISYSVFTAANKTERTGGDEWEVGEFDGHSLFFSGYYDFLNDKKFSPYIGVGFGPTLLDAGNINNGYYAADDSEVTFGYQGKLGITYQTTDSTDVFLEGVYQGTKAFRLGDLGDEDELVNPLKSFSTQIGVRYKF